MKKLCIIILNYNNYADTYECITSVLQAIIPEKITVEIVLVDNNSSDESGKALSALFDKDITFIFNSKNIGYAGGNNIGIKYALQNEADFICLLNNDTIVSKDFIVKSMEVLQSSEKIAFLSPVIEENNIPIVQSTGGNIRIKTGTVTLNNNGKKRSDLPEYMDVDYLGGACLFFKTSIINIIGCIPESYFLFFEETEWCYKAKKAGYKNVCITSTCIKHKGSASIDIIDGLHVYLMERNRIVFLKRNCDNMFELIVALVYLLLKYIFLGLVRNRLYFKYLLYMKDGLFNVVDLKKYPFIVVK